MNRVRNGVLVGLVACALACAGSALAGVVPGIETKGGFGFSKFTGDDPTAVTKHGFSGAIAVHIPIGSVFSVQPELAYAMKGTSYGLATDPVYGTTTYYGTFEQLYAADYLELPVLLRARVANGIVRPSLFAGPVVGWLMVEKFRLHSSLDGDYEGKGYALKALDFGAAGGVGFEFGPANRCLTLEARYTTSLANNLKPEFIGTVKNSDFRVQVGWKLEWKPGLGTM